jgi:hypothetical protein
METLADKTLPTTERFKTLLTAGYGEVLRGVSWTPVRGHIRDTAEFNDEDN